MLTHLFLATAVAASLSVPGYALAVALPSRAPSTQGSDLDYQATKGKYERALANYNAKRLESVSKGDKSIVPEHPAREFLPQFQSLADLGECRAMGWMLANLGFLYTDAAEVRRQSEHLFSKILGSSTTDECLLDTVTGIGARAKDIGEESAVEMIRLITEKSPSPEVRARGMNAHASIISDNWRTQDERRLADATTIQNAILDSYPKTKIAQQIAADTFRATEKAFLTLQHEWLAKVDVLVEQGRPMSDWPEHPIHRTAKEVKRVADTGFMEASTWYDAVYLGYTMNEKQGLPHALVFLVEALQAIYPAGFSEWDVVRMGTLEALYTVSPSEPWVYTSLRKVIEKTRLVKVELLEPVIDVLLAKSKDPAVRPVALYTLARSLVDRGEFKDLERAMPMYREVIEKYPDSDLAEPAKRLLSRLEKVMPGGKFPYFTFKDSGGVDFSLDDYKGRVVMLEFYSLKVGDYSEPAKQRAELGTRMAGRPFHVIGMNVDLITAKAFLSKSEQLGINWRSALILSRSHVIKWEVNKFPTTILLDADGIVRARDLPWPEMVKVTEELVAETEQKQRKQ